VVYALVNGTKNYDALTNQLGVVMTVHGAVMVVAGLGFRLRGAPRANAPGVDGHRADGRCRARGAHADHA
jgi:hypothetical protein